MQAESNGQFDCRRNSPGVSQFASRVQEFSHSDVGFGAEGFPCLIHSPLTQSQSSSVEKILRAAINRIRAIMIIRIIFVGFFILLYRREVFISFLLYYSIKEAK